MGRDRLAASAPYHTPTRSQESEMDRPVRSKLPNSKYADEAQGAKPKVAIQNMSPSSTGAIMQGRLVMLEKKFEELVKELKVQRSEDEQDRIPQCFEGKRRLEENEKRLVDENAHLRGG
ncbi:hypothetical protein E2C01_089947 [Portunus trituberculatus]|uniref:Uncharacterized protein n=1 Tax=Portunus trituberculatus TaxID=210409 RepID=A0A5B7JK47_PORTR|nr:hypothetical protein [Portunus trituberculatus]